MIEKKTGGITGRGFVKGDQRINRKGRPKSFDALRTLAQSLAHEVVTVDGQTMTLAESILRSWSVSDDPRLQVQFIEIAFGKVPTVTEVTGKEGAPIALTTTAKQDLSKLSMEELVELRKLVAKTEAT